MTKEQKAKRYDEALKVAKDIRKGKATYIPNGTPVIEAIFPELKESEDEKIRKEIISAVNIYCSEYHRGTKVRNDMLAWLEKQGEQKTVNIVTILNDYFANTPKEQQDKDWEELKHLNNSGWELVEQKPAWSEEDEKMFMKLHNTIYVVRDCGCDSSEKKELSDFLDSLKDRLTWKPSDEQIKAIKWIIDEDNPENWSITLKNLYQDLKKLKE